MLRELFFLRQLVEDTDDVTYTICAVNPYAYVMRLTGIGETVIDVHVNMWGGDPRFCRYSVALLRLCFAIALL